MGNDTELIKLRDEVKTKNWFQLFGERENILINILIINIYLYHLLVIISFIIVEQSYINNSNK